MVHSLLVQCLTALGKLDNESVLVMSVGPCYVSGVQCPSGYAHINAASGAIIDETNE